MDLLVPPCSGRPYRFKLDMLAVGSCWAEQFGHVCPAPLETDVRSAELDQI